MNKGMLQLGPGIALPMDIASDCVAILGQRGSGKSNTAVVFAEELWKAKIPWVTIDVKGDWWGIRSSADGKGPGLPVPIFGGQHADVPLEPGAGNYLADLVFDETLTCLLDLSEFSAGELLKFLVPFCHRLFIRHKREPTVREVIFEEAHRYIPQNMGDFGDKRVGMLKEATAKIPLEGRAFGLGTLVLSQRSSRLHKDVLTQSSMVIAHRSPAELDRKAIGGWVAEHGAAAGVLSTLAKLEDGEAWLLGAGDERRVRFRRRSTFDSGSTPKIGEARTVPKTIADVDLAAVSEKMSETIERAKADDPAELRRRIRELEQRARQSDHALLVAVEEANSRPVTVAEVMPQFVAALLREQIAQFDSALEALGSPRDGLSALLERVVDFSSSSEPAKPMSRQVTASTVRQKGQLEASASSTSGEAPKQEGRIAEPRRRILDSLAWFTSVGVKQVNRTQLALFAGVSPKSSAYGNNLGALRTAGLIDYPNKGEIELTGEGASIAESTDDIRTTADLHAALFSRLPEAKRRILEVLIAAYPGAVDRTALAEQIEASPTSSTYGNNLGALRSLGLIDYPGSGRVVAQPVLFLEGFR